MAEPLSEEELQEYDQYHPNEWTEETETRLRATIAQDRQRIAELEQQLAEAEGGCTEMRTLEADLPSIEDICGLWADEKDEGWGANG